MGSEAYRSRRLRRISLAAVLVVSASVVAGPGCAARRFDALMRSWEGHLLEDLFRTWGPPDYVYGDGQGGRVVVYVPSATADNPRTDARSARLREQTSERVYDAAMERTWPIHRVFFANPAGRIVATRWKGQWECCSN